MSTSKVSNQALNAVADKILLLVKNSQKLAEDHLAALTLAHEIAVNLASAFSQHGRTATTIALILLSCAAEIRDNSLNGRLKGLLDWSMISDDNICICTHPLYQKTVGYQHPLTSTTAPTPIPAPVQPSSQVSIEERAASLIVTPPVTEMKHDLFVQGMTKQKASTKKIKPTLAKLKKAVVGDDDDIPTQDVIFVKRKPTVGPRNQPLIAKDRPLSATESSESDAKDAVSPKETSSVRLFGMQCEHCIKDDIPCTIVLAKKSGEIKCHLPGPECGAILRGEVATHKAKVTAAAEKKAKKAKKAKKKTDTPALLLKSNDRPKAPMSTWSTCSMSKPWPQSPTLPTPHVELDEDTDSDNDMDLVLIFPEQATATPIFPTVALATSPTKHVNVESHPDIEHQQQLAPGPADVDFDCVEPPTPQIGFDTPIPQDAEQPTNWDLLL
ncbi:uncharacterized protein F5147DRAFT_652731 [Suillus discolor]|uniref:Uncharacterized protein n=1 Tax=Suillus discolor TaxID=1912936 RepID=A0A9P7F6L1_9AGAM|nr:uncharacterized protein F5147DRAFT_652731 [Suillus discolor]KAG2108744.1 hypothetical protein F5147DRAFT_652731 [Suillus discolor]